MFLKLIRSADDMNENIITNKRRSGEMRPGCGVDGVETEITRRESRGKEREELRFNENNNVLHRRLFKAPYGMFDKSHMNGSPSVRVWVDLKASKPQLMNES